VPGNKDVRLVKREITQLQDDGVAIREVVDETALLLAHAMTIANGISKDVREISWIRYCVEMDVGYELKNDRTLWDGTRVMSDDEGREKWENYLEEVENIKNGGRRKKELKDEAAVAEPEEELCVINARFCMPKHSIDRVHTQVGV
jgi:hypothetical protein